MKNVKGLVKVIKKKADTGETIFESDWKENLVFDAFFTSYQPGAALTGANPGTTGTSTALDPLNLMRGDNDRMRGGCYFIYGTDTYVPNISPSANSLPGTWYHAQPITATPHVLAQGNGGATGPTELKMTQQILPPAAGTRNLYTFGLNAFGISAATTSSRWRVQQTPLSAVSFASPVSQDTTEIIVVVYRLQFPYSTSSTKSLNNYIHFTHNLMGRANTNEGGQMVANTDFAGGIYYDIYGGRGRYAFWGVPDKGRIPNSVYVAGKPNSEAIYLNASSPAWQNESLVNRVGWDGVWHGSYKMTSTDTDVGTFRGSLIVSQSTSETASSISGVPRHNWTPILPPGADKTQQYFAKVSTATVPFFSATEVPNTDGTIVVDTSSYTPTFPELWKVDISGTTGGVGTPTYSFMKRKTLGWEGNTLTPKFENIITGTTASHGDTVTTEYSTLTEPYQEVFQSQYASGGSQYHDSQLHNLDHSDPSKFFTYANTTITFIKTDKPYSITYGAFYDSTFAPTALGQVEYDELSDTVWLSCYDTGIYSIQDPFGTPTFTSYDLSTVTDVTATVQNNCYAITVGTQSGANSYRVIWAFMEGALVKSTDNGATWTGYDSTSTGGTTFVNATIEANWNAAHVIKADRNNSDRILYLFDPSPTSDSALSLGGQTYAGKYKGEWWSPSGGTTNVLTTSGDLPIFYGGPSNLTKDIGWFFRTSNNTGSRATWNSDGYGKSIVRRYSQHLIGCTPRESNWYFSHFYLDRLGLSGTYNTAPLEIFWEQQIGGSPANYTEFTVGDTFDEKWENDAWQYSYQRTGNIPSGNFDDIYDVNSAYMYTHILDRNDDGHECLIQSNGRNNNIHMFEFNGSRTTLLGAFGTSQDGGITNGTYYNRYLGGGLVLMNCFGAAISDGTTFLGIDPAKKLVGDIWKRYKWNGASWVLRQDDNDPLTLKTTHSSTDALVGGATISFDDAGATQTFDSGESISFHVCNGVLNDAGTNFEIHCPDMSFWDSERVTEVTGATIALNTPSDLVPEIYYDSVGEEEGTLNIDIGLGGSSGEEYIEDTYNVLGVKAAGIAVDFSRIKRCFKYSDKIYPCTRWFGGVVQGSRTTQFTCSAVTPGEIRTSIRKKTTLGASGNFEAEFQLMKGLDKEFLAAANMPLSIHDLTVWEGNSNELVMNAYVGVVNSANYSDTSPVTAPYTINDFDYGFRVRHAGPSTTTSNMSTSYDPSIDWSGIANKSELYNEGSRPSLNTLTIEVIESGSVVYTHTDTESWHSIFNEHKDNITPSSRMDALSTVDTWNTSYNISLPADSRQGLVDPINARRCPFTIKRDGTTITYYLRDNLIYTSAATSTEDLIPAQLHEVVSTTSQGTSAITEYGVHTMSFFKKPAASDYWVRVGTSGSGNASFNPDFLYMQMAFREAFSIKIDGVEATVTGLEDNGTLSAGEVSVFPRQGLIRCAAADAGKTVTVSIPCAYR